MDFVLFAFLLDIDGNIHRNFIRIFLTFLVENPKGCYNYETPNFSKKINKKIKLQRKALKLSPS